jgi:hypothetical protein
VTHLGVVSLLFHQRFPGGVQFDACLLEVFLGLLQFASGLGELRAQLGQFRRFHRWGWWRRWHRRRNMRGALAGLGGLGLRRRQLSREHLVGLQKVFDLLIGLGGRDLAELFLKLGVQLVACRLQLLDLLTGALQLRV